MKFVFPQTCDNVLIVYLGRVIIKLVRYYYDSPETT